MVNTQFLCERNCRRFCFKMFENCRKCDCYATTGRVNSCAGCPIVCCGRDDKSIGNFPSEQHPYGHYVRSAVRGRLDCWRIFKVLLKQRPILTMVSLWTFLFFFFFSELIDPERSLVVLLKSRSLPGHIQGVYVHNIIKLFTRIITDCLEKKDIQGIIRVSLHWAYTILWSNR